MIYPVVKGITGAQQCSMFIEFFNWFFILLGVNAEGRCAIMSNATDWRYYCVIIRGIWNDASAFCIFAGMEGSSSAIMGSWGVCVGVGVVV